MKRLTKRKLGKLMNDMSKDAEAGFTLLELMICLAMVAVLTMLALPNYHHYLRKAYYLEIVQAAMPYKLGVASCFQSGNGLASCHGGEQGVPPDQQNVSALIASISTYQGQIHIVPHEVHGIEGDDDFLLTPVLVGGQLDWHVGGGGVERGYVH